MLAARPDIDAAYVAVWTHLQKTYPRLRTVLVTGVSRRDDAAVAARELARAAARLPHIVAGDRHADESNSDAVEMTSRASSESGGSVQIVDATRSAPARASASQADGNEGLTIIVAPPPQQSPDCISLASAADATVLVATRGRTKSRDARAAANLLQVAGVEIAAALLLTEPGSHRGATTAAVTTVTQIPVAISTSDGSPPAAGDRPQASS